MSAAILPNDTPALTNRPVRSPKTVVMTVEDDSDLQLSIVDVLEDKGFFPVVVADGQEALDLLRGGFRPSVILLDLMMPRMNGRDFRREQNNDIALKDIPVVVTTGEDLGESTKTAEFGKVGWLSKPFGLDALLTAIESALVSESDVEVHQDDDRECHRPFLRSPDSQGGRSGPKAA